MAFVKLDTGILNSTLWDDRAGRDVFITALLMAEPVELTVATPTLAIRAIEPTGFVIPPGWYGMVHAAGVGIIRQSLVATDEGMDALDRLSAPEAGSRSQDFDGRRLVRIDGGFIVLNYMKYRDRDYTTAIRSQRYRERKKERASRVTITPVTQAEAEGELDTEEALTKAPAPQRQTAEAAWDAVIGWLPDWQRKLWTPDRHSSLDEWTKRALSSIGGFATIHATAADKLVWVKREFFAAFNKP